jgi:hypothetical protein
MNNKELYDFAQNMKNLLSVAEIETANIVENSENDIILKNKEQIFVKGETVEGDDLGTYTRFTEQINENQNFTLNGLNKQKIEGEKYFLLDTGDFFNSFKLQKKNEKQFEIVAQVQKPQVNIIEKFGNVIGLQQENENEITKNIVPELAEVLENFLLNY